MCLYLISISRNDDDQCFFISYPYQAMMVVYIKYTYQAMMIINVPISHIHIKNVSISFLFQGMIIINVCIVYHINFDKC